MRPLVNHWPPLTHTSVCMTTSRPEAAIQMRARVSKAVHTKCFYNGCPSCLFISRLADWLRICWLAYPEASQCQITLTKPHKHPFIHSSSCSRMCFMSHNWSATKQRLHPQSVAEISRHSVLSGDRIRQCETSSGSRHKDTDQCL